VIRLPQPNRPALSSPPISQSLYSMKKHPHNLSVKEKVSVVKRANAVARKLDPHVQQVRVLYRDVHQKLSISNSEGLFVEGEREGSFFLSKWYLQKGYCSDWI